MSGGLLASDCDAGRAGRKASSTDSFSKGGRFGAGTADYGSENLAGGPVAAGASLAASAGTQVESKTLSSDQELSARS